MENGLLYLLAFSAMAIALFACVLPQAPLFGELSGLPYGEDYTIYRLSNTYYAQDSNGIVTFSGTNASDIYRQVLATSPESIFTKGDTIELTNSIVISEPLKFYGEGNATAFTLADNANCDLIKVSDFNTLLARTQLTFTDFTLNGNKAANTAGVGLNITAINSVNIVITRLLINNTASYAVYCNSQVVYFTNNFVIDTCRRGVWIDNGNNYVAFNDLGSGLFASQWSRGQIVGNNIFNAPDIAGVFSGGLYLRDSREMQVFSNTIIDNQRGGIVLEGLGTRAMRGYQIVGNNIIDNAINVTYAGIVIQGGTETYPIRDLVITGNSISSTKGTQDYGIQLRGYITDAVIGDNNFFNHTSSINYHTSIVLGGVVNIHDNTGYNPKKQFINWFYSGGTQLVDYGNGATWVSTTTYTNFCSPKHIYYNITEVTVCAKDGVNVPLVGFVSLSAGETLALTFSNLTLANIQVFGA